MVMQLKEEGFERCTGRFRGFWGDALEELVDLRINKGSGKATPKVNG